MTLTFFSLFWHGITQIKPLCPCIHPKLFCFLFLYSVKVRKFLLYNLRQKEQNLNTSTKLFIFFYIFLQVKKALCHDILSSYQLASVTKAFSLKETFECGRKNSVTKTFFLWEIYFFCDKNWFFITLTLGQKLVSVMETCFLKGISISDRNLILGH